jgi:hypothetical protein
MLRRCNSRGNFSILNVTEHTSKETDPPEVDPSSKILRTITECLEQNCTLNVKRNSFGDFAGAQPEIRTSFGPGTWRPDGCYEEMKGAVTSFTTYELPLVAAMAHDGTGIKLDEQTQFSNPVLKERLGQLSWFKQANQALAGLKDAASNFMAGPPRVEAKELQLDDARWSALFTKAPPRFASL